MMRRRLVGSVLLLGCAGTDLDVGRDTKTESNVSSVGASGGTGGSGGGVIQGGGVPGNTEPLPTLPAQTGCPTDPGLEGLVGTWEGSLEDFYLNEIEHVRIQINGVSSAQGVCGTLTWGTREAPPPADDPEAIYPSSDYWSWDGGGGGGSLPPIEGFPYTITNGGERLPNFRLAVSSSEPWQSFCALQAPVPAGDGWACVDASEGYTLEPYPAVDGTCTVAGATHTSFMCQSCITLATDLQCRCDQNGCVAAHDRDVKLELALSEDGNALEGPFAPCTSDYCYTYSGGSRWSYGSTLYLERVEN